MTIELWTRSLAEAIAAALTEFAPQLIGQPVSMFAVDCHPWHGTLGLSMLTAAEVEADELLFDPSEMAAWRFHHFSDGLDSWRASRVLASEMKATYYAGNTPSSATPFFTSVAEAVANERVEQSLARFSRGDRFRLSVAHPDSGREYVSGERVPPLRPGSLKR